MPSARCSDMDMCVRRMGKVGFFVFEFRSSVEQLRPSADAVLNRVPVEARIAATLAPPPLHRHSLLNHSSRQETLWQERPRTQMMMR